MIKSYGFKIKSLIGSLAFLCGVLPVMHAQVTVQNFSYTGAVQTFTVPSCVFNITITAKGAQGGTNAANTVTGGPGGTAVGVLSVTPGDVLNIYVGGMNGYNGGGNAGSTSGCTTANGGVGGGASDVRLNGVALTDRVIVGGGGGGAGGDRIPTCGRGAGGGGGGGYYGGGGGAGWPGSVVGGTVASGGSQAAGGTGGTSTFATVNNGFAGSLGLGGHGGGEVGSSQGTPQHNSFTGGGGGGLNGGNGIHTFASSFWAGQSGAGGSSYTGTLSSASTTSANNTGNGSVQLAYTFGGGIVSISPSATTICSGANINLTAVGPVLSYTWSNGSNASSINVSPTTNTTYVVLSTNAISCVSSATVSVIVNSGSPVLSVTSSTNATCFGRTATLTASGANTYTWTNNVSNGVSFTPSVTTTYVVSGQNACGTSTAATTISVTPLPVSVIVTPTMVCASNSATITTASSATTYSWLPLNTVNSTGSLVVSPLVPTTYTIAATDGTCSGVALVSLAVNPLPTVNATASSTNVCQGDAVVLTATGGLNYTWTPGNLAGSTVTVNPMAPTAYNVVGDNQFGCTSGASAVIITNPSPVLTTQASGNLICAGESVTLSVSGASTYVWSNASTNTVIVESPTSSTVYSVTGTMNGCSTTETLQVDVFINNLAVAGNTSVCQGLSTTLTASGASSYTWEPGTVPSNAIVVSPTVNTTYTLSTLTSTGSLVCPGTTTVEVTIKPNPNVVASPDRSIMCRGESNTITASGANSYVWLPGGSTGPSIAITSSLVTVLNYTVTGTGANGCTKTNAIQVVVNACNGLNEISQHAIIRVYPNPSRGDVTIASEEDMQVTIVNQLGQVIDTLSLSAGNAHAKDVKALSKGIYFVNGVTSQEKVTFKLIVE